METIAGRLTALVGLCAVLSLLCAALSSESDTASEVMSRGRGQGTLDGRVRFLALGDVNLGRTVGQQILAGDTLYPFTGVMDSLAAFDVVFANLESSLSDQDGETESPGNNIVFTGPPAGAAALHRAGITVVSTANNHALDYGVDAEEETLVHLDEAGVHHAGTAYSVSSPYAPALFTTHGVRFAVFACTGIMNGNPRNWSRSVAKADTTELLRAIRAVRDSADFVVVSYHGGDEYASRPASATKEFARMMIDGGADLFLGHHPHVSYGIEVRAGRYIVHSLGNFVFRQPSRYTTRWSFAFSADLRKDSLGTRVESFHCLPVAAGFRPRFVTSGADADSMYGRIIAFSSREVTEHMTWQEH